MSKILVFSWFLTLPLLAADPAFICQDKTTQYRIELTPKLRALHIHPSQGGPRTIKLTSANASGLFELPNDPLVYNAVVENAGPDDPRIDVGQELGIHYTVEGGSTHVRLWIVLNHTPVRNLTCTHKRIQAQNIHTEITNPAVDSANLMNLAAMDRGSMGHLLVGGLLSAESAVRRLFNSPEGANPQEVAVFIEKATEGIEKIAPESLEVVKKRMPDKERAYFEGILEKMNYKNYPETKRLITWVNEGIRPAPHRNLDSVRGGFWAFSRSKHFDIDRVRKDFAAGVAPAMTELTREELRTVSRNLDVQSKTLLTQLWSLARISQYPEIAQITKELSDLVYKQNFEPNAIKEKIMEFWTSPLKDNEEALEIWLGAASPHIKNLTERQLEDVFAWFEKSEQDYFKKMLE